MARMLPPLSDGFVFRSEAERTIYHWLDSETPAEWVALHSVWLKNSDRKEHAEVDFLLITGTSFICIEVKGHKVWRDAEGNWCFETLDGLKSEIRNEGPFDQAKEAYYAVKNTLNKFGRSDLFFNRVWGYGVITPDCALDFRKGDGWLSPAMLIDARKFPEDAASAIDDLQRFWLVENEGQKKKIGRSVSELLSPSEADRLELIQILRPKIEVISGPGISAKSSLREANALTEEQFETLTAISDNPRILIRGLAGTGKTMLAVEQARLRSKSGHVLFVCYNKNLAKKLSSDAALRGQTGVTYLNYHQLVLSVADLAGIAVKVAEDWQKFNQSAVDVILASLSSLGQDFTPYDYLVVDEAQDLMSSEFFGVLDLLIDGGLESGSWLVSMDPGQILYDAQFDEESLNHIERLGVTLRLNKNCRNTRQIASYVAGLSAICPEQIRAVDGPQVELDYWDDFGEYEKALKSYLNHYITDFRNSGLPLSEIILLVSDKRFVEELSPEIRKKILVPPDQFDPLGPDNGPSWSSIHGFKGLESTAVIVVFNGDLGDEGQKRLFYVAGSRARANLIALFPSTAESAVNRALPEVMKLLRPSS